MVVGKMVGLRQDKRRTVEEEEKRNTERGTERIEDARCGIWWKWCKQRSNKIFGKEDGKREEKNRKEKKKERKNA